MSSIDVNGDNNRAAGRDFYENCEWNLHLYAAPAGQPPGGNESPQDPPTLERLLEMRAEARSEAFRTTVRRYLNRPTIITLTGFILTLLVLLSILGGLAAYLEAPWLLAAPIALLMGGSLYWNRSLPQIRVIREEALRAERWLNDIEMEIARRKYRKEK
ncbi:hypothetical protein [Marinobacter shengliensis]